MADTKQYKSLFAGAAGGGVPDAAEIDTLVARYPWFMPARALRTRLTAIADPRLELLAPWRAESALRAEAIDVEALTHLSTEDVIDRFLREEDLRIVAGEGEPEEEVRTEAVLADEDEIVSEELAEIYLAQGLRQEAIAIYRKLSLLNSEKSIYFAELIDNIEKNN